MTDLQVYTMDNRFAFSSEIEGLRQCLKRFGDDIPKDLGERELCNRDNFRWWLHDRQIRHIHTALVKRPDDKIVGTASWFIEPKLIHGGSYVGHIEDVAVLEGYEGMGVGRAVVEYAIQQCRVRGCYKVILDCSESNAMFYEKLGFRRHENCMRLGLTATSIVRG
jgi:GNAT superfamily N-acetyltransferase